ncbi:MAG: BLUF domain-containing protein [Hyphomicrobiales bacterium]|nr:BLUF domain-containing protein [Hyphomicrobiales bacterium]
MNLCRLVYYSERNQSAALDIKQLITTCHKNNTRVGVTGMLHYDGPNFVQVLEGGRTEISQIFIRIAGDPRHQKIILMSCQDVRERLFPGWSMGLHEGMPEKTKAIYLRYFATDRIDPAQANVESLLDVLQDLAAEM